MMIPPSENTNDSTIIIDSDPLITISSSNTNIRRGERRSMDEKIQSKTNKVGCNTSNTSSPRFSATAGTSKLLLTKTNITLNGTSNYWKRSRFSWICLLVLIIGFSWFYNWWSEHQRKLRFMSYLERAEQLDSMINTMEGHISSAQLKLKEFKQLQIKM